MAEKVKYVPLYNQWRNFTLKDFIQKVHIFAANSDGSEKSIDDVVNDLFNDNKELIFNQMTDSDKRDFAFYKKTNSYPTENDKSDINSFEEKIKDNYPKSSSDLVKDMIIPYPCKLQINAHCITSELMISQTNFQEMEDDFYAFEDEQIAAVLDEPEYEGNSFSKSQPKCTVIIWSRSDVVNRGNYTGNDLVNNANGGIWRNLSAFVINVSTNVTQQGGTFNIRMPYLLRQEEQHTSTIEDLVTKEEKGNYEYLLNDLERDNSIGNFLRIDNTVSDRKSLINKLVSTNDLVFISFNAFKFSNEFVTWSKQDNGAWDFGFDKILSENSVDMIGLVDNVSFSKTFEGAQGVIEISGRDLSKLLIDDGSFFFNPSTTSAPSQVFFNEQGYAKQGDIREVDKMNGTYQAINRMRRTKGELDIFCNQPNQTIGYVIKGVLSQLANIEVVPSDTFERWDNRTKWLDMHPDDEIIEEEVTKVSESNNNETEMLDNTDAATPTEEEIEAAESAGS